MKRFLVFLLAILMTASVLSLVACNNDTPSETPKDDPSDKPSTPTTPTDPEDGGEDEDEDPADARIPLDLPELYYGGEAQFHIVEWTANSSYDAGTTWIPWHEGDATEDADDLMGAAIFARNAYVEEKYGVEITQEYVIVDHGENIQRVLIDNQTGDNNIQLTTTRSLNAWSLIESGLLLDMNDYAGEILHTDQPWWVQDAVESYTLGDSLYVCSTEMLLRDKGATCLLYYNTKVADDFELSYLPELVEDGDWTFENMITACEVVGGDRDGDDLINTTADMWGAKTADDAIFMLYAGAGFKHGRIGDDGYFVFEFAEKDSMLFTQEIFERVMYADWAQSPGYRTIPGEGHSFKMDLALLDFSQVKFSYTLMRDMETPYGVLPIPKYDENQEDYCSLVWVHHDCVLGIPSGAKDPEMCAVILEALSYEGYYSVTPVLYETLLYNRLAKTEQARRGFEIAFATRVYDPGQYWVSDTIFGNKLLRYTKTGTSGIATLWGENESAVMAQVEKVNEFIDEAR